MNDLERARFDLEMILPYVEHLQRKVNMGKEGYPIRERTHTHNHAGKASEHRGIAAAVYQLKMWKDERIAAHEQGHRPSEFPDGNSLCFPGEVGGHFQDLQAIPQDQEIVLFEQPLTEEQRLANVKRELELIKYSAQFYPNGDKM